MSDIFISYKREDRPVAHMIRQRLKKLGFSVWWDRKIPCGKSFDQVIQEALAEAACVIVLWSRRSIASDWVKDEAAKGARRGILVPALIDDVTVPLGFGRLQTADLVGWFGEPDHPGFSGLCNAVSMLLGRSVPETSPVLETSALGSLRGCSRPAENPPPAPVPVTPLPPPRQPVRRRRGRVALTVLAILLFGSTITYFAGEAIREPELDAVVSTVRVAGQEAWRALRTAYDRTLEELFDSGDPGLLDDRILQGPADPEPPLPAGSLRFATPRSARPEAGTSPET